MNGATMRIIRAIQSERMQWALFFAFMGGKGHALRLLWRNLKEKDHIKSLDFNLRITVEWFQINSFVGGGGGHRLLRIKKMEKWQVFVYALMKIQVPFSARNFSSNWWNYLSQGGVCSLNLISPQISVPNVT